MTKNMKLALATMLVTGLGGVTIAAPASAAKKDDASTMKLSPEFLKAAQPAQTALQAKDYTAAEPLVAQAEAAAKTDNDRYVAASLRYNLENNKLYAASTANPDAPIDETALAKPLDTLIASPVTPQADKARYTYRRGALLYNSRQYGDALKYFQQAQQLGSTEPNLPLLITKSKIESGDAAGGLAQLDQTIQQMNAAGQKAPEEYYRYAIARSSANNMKPEAMMWLKRYITAYPSPKNWRDVIYTYGLQGKPLATLDDAQRIDLFRLMRATGSLADQNDYLEYAEDVNRKGLPDEAQAIIKEGQAAGKIPAGNSNATLILSSAAKSQKNDVPLATTEKRALASSDGKIAAGTGDAYLGQGNYAKAIELYRAALQKGGVNADEVNTHLGIALAKSGDKAAAKTAFAAVTTAPRAGIAELWTTYVDMPAA